MGNVTSTRVTFCRDYLRVYYQVDYAERILMMFKTLRVLMIFFIYFSFLLYTPRMAFSAFFEAIANFIQS